MQQVTRTIFTVTAISKEIVETITSFQHPFDYHIPQHEVIEVSTMFSAPRAMRVAGRQLPATITLYDDNDMLLFKLKYFNEILYTESEELLWE